MALIADKMSYFNADDNKCLSNPHIGFQTFQRFNGDPLYPPDKRAWTEGYPIEYQPFKSLTQELYPATTVAYYRVYWRYFEPQEGKYNWELFDRALATAAERGQTLMIRLPPYAHTSQPGNKINVHDDVPDWLRQRIDPGMKTIMEEGTAVRYLSEPNTVDPNNPEYVAAYARAIGVLAARYDADPRLDSVDMSICGCWGEENTLPLMSVQNRNIIIHAFLDNFKVAPVIAQSNQWEIHDLPCNVPMEMDNRIDVLNYMISQNRRVGLRGDCLGDMSYRTDTTPWRWGHMRQVYPYLFGAPGICDMWQRGPITFESGGVMWNWVDNGADLEEVLDQALRWHTSTFSNKGSPVPPQYRQRVDKFCQQMGYRYAFRNLNYPGMAKAGDTLQMAMLIQNRGNSPMYRPYPFTLRMVGEGVDIRYTHPADIRDWLPGDIALRAFWTLPEKINPGTCQIQAAILGHDGNPAVQFGCDAPVAADGWMTVGQIEIQ